MSICASDNAGVVATRPSLFPWPRSTLLHRDPPSRLLDCSFGILGLIPLLAIRHQITHLEQTPEQ